MLACRLIYQDASTAVLGTVLGLSFVSHWATLVLVFRAVETRKGSGGDPPPKPEVEVE